MPSLAGRRKTIAGSLAIGLAASLAAGIIASSDGNRPPTVSAGSDATVETGVAHELTANCADDGEPDPPAVLGCTLEQSSGTGCTFEDDAFDCTSPDSPDLDVTCSVAGVQGIRLCCDDDGAGPNQRRCDTMVLTVTEPAPDCADPHNLEPGLCRTTLLADLQAEGFEDYSLMVPADIELPTITDQIEVAGDNPTDTAADIRAACLNDGTFVIVTTTADVQTVDFTGRDQCMVLAYPGFEAGSATLSGSGTNSHIHILGGEWGVFESYGATTHVVLDGVVAWRSDFGGSAVRLEGTTQSFAMRDSVAYGRNGILGGTADLANYLFARVNMAGENILDDGENCWCMRQGGSGFAWLDGSCTTNGNFTFRGILNGVWLGLEDPVLVTNLNDNGNVFGSDNGAANDEGSTARDNIVIRMDPPGTVDPQAGALAPKAATYKNTVWEVADDTTWTTSTLDGLESNCVGVGEPCIAYAADRNISIVEAAMAEPTPPTISSAALCAAVTACGATCAGWYPDCQPVFNDNGTPRAISNPLDLRPPQISAGSDGDAEIDVAFNVAASCTHRNPNTTCTWTTSDDCAFTGDVTDIACDNATVDVEVTCGTVETATLTLTCTNPTGVPSVDTVDYAVASTALPLDNTVTWNFVWWIPARLLTSYTGPLIRIRDVDDNAEIDVGCTGSTSGTCDGAGTALDTSAIGTHCNDGTGVCTLVNVQDQSGNNYDVTAPADANEPVIYESSAVVTCGTQSIPCARFADQNGFGDTGGDYLVRSDSCGWTGNPGFQVWAAWMSAGATDDRGLISFGQIPSGSTPRGIVLMPANGTMDASTQTGTSLRCTNGSHATFAHYLMENPGAGDNSDTTLYRNGTAMSVATSGAGDAFSFGNVQCGFGTMLFTNGSFTVDGRSPGGFASDDPDLTSMSAIDAFLDGEI